MQHSDEMDMGLVERDKPRIEDLRDLGIDDLLSLIIDWTPTPLAIFSETWTATSPT